MQYYSKVAMCLADHNIMFINKDFLIGLYCTNVRLGQKCLVVNISLAINSLISKLLDLMQYYSKVAMCLADYNVLFIPEDFLIGLYRTNVRLGWTCLVNSN
jgi:hypothetical protein